MDVVPFQQNPNEAAMMAAVTDASAIGGPRSSPSTRRESNGRRWTKSLTGSMTVVCFIFGGLVAMQVRAYQRVQRNRDDSARGQVAAEMQIRDMRDRLTNTNKQNVELSTDLDHMKKQVESGQKVGQSQLDQLKSQIKDLQMVAGLTAVTGPGVTITLDDNPEVSKAGLSSGMPLPGIVHDFDLQQVVNELRAAGAEAIAISGTRITGYTPIRCVGPVININWEHVAPPYRVQAIGDSERLSRALSMPSGIVEQLRNQVIVVRINDEHMLRLPAAEDMPSLRVAKPAQ